MPARLVLGIELARFAHRKHFVHDHVRPEEQEAIGAALPAWRHIRVTGRVKPVIQPDRAALRLEDAAGAETME